MDVDLHGRGSSNGLPVVFVHASVFDRREFDLVALQEGCQYLTYDRRGCGRIPDVPEDVDIDDLCDVLDELNRPALLVSSLDGASVALHATAARPAQVGGVVLAAPLLNDLPLPEVQLDLHADLRSSGLVDGTSDSAEVATEIALFDTWLTAYPVSARAEALLRAMFADNGRAWRPGAYPCPALPPVYEVAAQVQVPVGVIIGAEESDDVAQAAPWLMERLRDGHLVVAERAGRLVCLERPDLLAQAIAAGEASIRSRYRLT